MLRGVRRTAGRVERPVVGVASIRRLEEAGFRTMLDLARANLEDLVRAGLRRAFARQILAYARRYRHGPARDCDLLGSLQTEHRPDGTPE
jgi:hypothetical protein